MFAAPIRRSPELDRILRLPRRDPNGEDLEQLAHDMTQLLKLPEGTQKLRPIQALALRDIAICGGLFGPIPVGFGKSLISFLSFYVADSVRPLLVLPAALLAKTERERKQYAKHWLIPEIRLCSYELLGRVQGAQILETYKPDMIVLDEGHRARNKHAAVTRRLSRYIGR
jgi:hypothetical protein